LTQILRLPATGCGHFIRGRCLYEEHLNPGYQAGYRCAVLEKLQAFYDSFLTQADAFGLEESVACGIWEKRLRELCQEDTGCQDHKPDAIDSFPGCLNCLEDVCVLKLPECAGRCQNFTSKSRG
jgi:hypothetical protein